MGKLSPRGSANEVAGGFRNTLLSRDMDYTLCANGNHVVEAGLPAAGFSPFSRLLAGLRVRIIPFPAERSSLRNHNIALNCGLTELQPLYTRPIWPLMLRGLSLLFLLPDILILLTAENHRHGAGPGTVRRGTELRDLVLGSLSLYGHVFRLHPLWGSG